MNIKTFYLIALAACGPTTPGTGLGTGPGNNQATPPAEDTTANVRFVHMFAEKDGTPGPAVDVYRRWGLINIETAPIVRGLTYGNVSSFVRPLLETDDAQTSFAFFTSGAVTGSPSKPDGVVAPYRGFVLDQNFKTGTRSTVNIISSADVGGAAFSPAWNVRQEAPVQSSSSFPPAANAAKGRLIINPVGLGAVASPNFYYVGSAGVCQTAVGQSAPSLLVSDASVFDFDGGAYSISLFKNPDSGSGVCTGTHDAGPVAYTSVIGTRTWLYFYGSSNTLIHSLVLPFGE